jgi:hypothetical protein
MFHFTDAFMHEERGKRIRCVLEQLRRERVSFDVSFVRMHAWMDRQRSAGEENAGHKYRWIGIGEWICRW